MTSDMSLDKKIDNMKVEIIMFVKQLGVKSVVVTYDEYRVQVICSIIQLFCLSNTWFRWVNVFDIVYGMSWN